MKKGFTFFRRKKANPLLKLFNRGFTLIELLVVIAIIAILATIGIAVYSNAPKGARDAKRKADIDAISKALELNKANDSTYNALSNNNFTSQTLPADPGNTYKYCVSTTTPLTKPTQWDGSTCPTQPGHYAEITTSDPFNPSSGTKNWIICAHLENDPSNQFYCTSNAQ